MIKKVNVKFEMMFYDPNKLKFNITKDKVEIEKTDHYINSFEVKYKIVSNYSEYVYLDLPPDKFDKYIKQYIDVGSSYKAKIYTLWGMYVTYSATISLYSTIYKQSFIQIKNETTTFVGSYDEVICTGNQFCYNNWGHSFQDFIQPLLLFPINMVKKSKLISNFHPALNQILYLFGISQNQIISMKINQSIFCNILHTITPQSFEIYYADLGMKVKQIFFKEYHLDSYVSHLYCFCNRHKPHCRRIFNFEEILNFVQQQYTNITFIEINDTYQTIKENAIMLAQVKFLFAPTGSNLIKTYFMQNESVIVSIGSNNFYWRYDNSILMSAVFTRIFILQFVAPIEHYSPGANISIDLCFKYIKKGIYCARYSKWPNLEMS